MRLICCVRKSLNSLGWNLREVLASLNPSIPILSRFPSISDFLARSGFQHHLIASSGFQHVEVLPQWDKRKKDDPMILSVGGQVEYLVFWWVDPRLL